MRGGGGEAAALGSRAWFMVALAELRARRLPAVAQSFSSSRSAARPSARHRFTWSGVNCLARSQWSTVGDEGQGIRCASDLAHVQCTDHGADREPEDPPDRSPAQRRGAPTRRRRGLGTGRELERLLPPRRPGAGAGGPRRSAGDCSGEQEAARFLDALERPDEGTIARLEELRRRA